MADRQVNATGKDRDGDITALCGLWGKRLKHDAIYDIENGHHTYYVWWNDIGRTEIRVVQGAYGKYLRTDRDDTIRNNLDDMPDC